MDNMILEASGIYKNYGDLAILKGLDFSIGEGEGCLLIGQGGRGKSTLLNVLALLDGKNGGKILYYGKDTDLFKPSDFERLRRHVIGFVFQNSLLFEDFSALENVLLALNIAGFNKKDAYDRAEEVLIKMGLKDRFNHRPKELSGGERQRVALARAVANGARLIFLDEPTGSLDEESKKSVEELLFSSSLRCDGISFILVTHDSDLSRKTETRYVLRGGVLERL